MGVLNRVYTHLLEPDIALLMDWQTDHASEYDNFVYDLRVGPGRDPGPDTSENIRKMALDLSRRRIDCVARAKDHYAVIEICNFAGYRTIGQLPIYAEYFIHDHNPDRPVKTAILCRSMADDLRPLCDKLGYIVWIYPLTDNDSTPLGHPPTT